MNILSVCVRVKFNSFCSTSSEEEMCKLNSRNIASLPWKQHEFQHVVVEYIERSLLEISLNLSLTEEGSRQFVGDVSKDIDFKECDTVLSKVALLYQIYWRGVKVNDSESLTLPQRIIYGRIYHLCMGIKC